ncbi:MAG: MBL fold metallo-hydrolase [Gammaproteobacteria bacterium]|nr:MBL fold metallo-hydrolase [Gammaproteobacteria bacterium]
MRFASLGSGSRGNATLIAKDDTCLLVDCGFTIKETERRLERLGKQASDLTGILVTHEHGDHISGVGPLARKYKVPVWMTPGTHSVQRCGELSQLELFNSHESFSINGLEVQPFPVPHDAREPAQFVFSDGSRRLGLLTDTGSLTPHIMEQLNDCDALLLECNHDSEMLANSDYPYSLKQRVAGRLGHLSNEQAADLIAQRGDAGLQHLVAMHLSEQNNTEVKVRQALGAVLGCDDGWIGIARQEEGLEWREIV